MASALALVAAFVFAVAATFQQKGALTLGVSPESARSLVRLLGSSWWLFGSAALLCGYAVRAVALDNGRQLQADAATSFVESWNDLMAMIDTQSAALTA